MIKPHLSETVEPSGSEESAAVEFHHISVLGREVLAALNPQPGDYFLDATVGGGGHSRLLLEATPDGRVMALDQDTQALQAARQVLQPFGDRVEFWQGNFAAFMPGDRRFQGILADLGVSSAQFDIPERGFSFRHTAPLDMRMDRDQELTAADIVNQWDERDLADIFFTYGEERLSRRLARQIVQRRPFHTTTDLAEAIAQSVPPKYRYGRIHPATRVFQALRIAVNQELTVLEQFLAKAPTWLAPGGRLAIISFHSLEDRLVKHAFRNSPLLQVLTKKPITPQPDELAANGRSRSAKLRVAMRIEPED